MTKTEICIFSLLTLCFRPVSLSYYIYNGNLSSMFQFRSRIRHRRCRFMKVLVVLGGINFSFELNFPPNNSFLIHSTVSFWIKFIFNSFKRKFWEKIRKSVPIYQRLKGVLYWAVTESLFQKVGAFVFPTVWCSIIIVSGIRNLTIAVDVDQEEGAVEWETEDNRIIMEADTNRIMDTKTRITVTNHNEQRISSNRRKLNDQNIFWTAIIKLFLDHTGIA